MIARRISKALGFICTIALLLSFLNIFAGSASAAGAPANDNFASATVIAGLPFSDSVDLSTATTEPDEPQRCYSSAQTVWYAFTPTADSRIKIDPAGSSFDTTLALYQATGSGIDGLSFLGCANYSDPLGFNVRAGTTYYIQAGDIYSYGGTLHITIQVIPPPSNDAFANATPITTLPFTDNVEISAAGVEAGEPTSCGSPDGTAWYVFTPAESGSVTANITYYSIALAAYTGSTPANLTQVGCSIGGYPLTFHVDAGTTYYIQIEGTSGFVNPVQFQLSVAPAPVANFFFYPFDPSSFDTIQFYNNSYDPAYAGFQSWAWDFGDGTTASEGYTSHRYASDGDYTVSLSVTTTDGRTASTTQTVHVQTHDVAIITLGAPQAARVGQTREIAVDLSSKRYPENVQVQLLKSTPNGFVVVGTLSQTVPVRSANRTTRFSFIYTFTSDDANIGKVTFKAVADIVGGHDALPADNEAIASPTKVSP